MEKVVFGDNRVSLSFGVQKINLHELGNEFEPKAQNVNAGSADICFISSTPIGQIVSHLREFKVPVLEGPVKRTGATGEIISV